jgi:hypothetical protein
VALHRVKRRYLCLDGDGLYTGAECEAETRRFQETVLL